MSELSNSAILKEFPLKKATLGWFWKFQWHLLTTHDRLKRFHAKNSKLIMHDLGLHQKNWKYLNSDIISHWAHPKNGWIWANWFHWTKSNDHSGLSLEGHVFSRMFYGRNRKMTLFATSYFELYRELFLHNNVCQALFLHEWSLGTNQ